MKGRHAADTTEDSSVVLYVLTVLHASWFCSMVFLVELPGCLFSPCRRRRSEELERKPERTWRLRCAGPDNLALRETRKYRRVPGSVEDRLGLQRRL